MKVSNECRQCLDKLARQAVEFATEDLNLRAKVITKALEILEGKFSPDKVSTEIANEIHRTIRILTRNPDPYQRRKEAELELARRLIKEVHFDYNDDFRSCIKLSLRGNAIDFFKDLREVSQEMRNPVHLAIDEIDKVEKEVQKAKRVLFLADNAGECFFDLPLLTKMRRAAQVIYVVKGFPVQNDITLEELDKAGLTHQIGEVITTGTATVGIELSQASPEFRWLFESADLVVTKGMGYYETLSELPPSGKIVYCLRAKCPPTARALKVPLDSYVVMMQ